MIHHLDPKLDILPPPQKILWEEFSTVPKEFILYGGTAIALQIGHRESIDFDFFGSADFNPDELLNRLPFLEGGKVTQREKSTLTVVVDRNGPVSLSFFGLPTIRSIKLPLKVQSNGIQVASLLDLAGMKVSVVQKRAEWKDYVDIAALIDHGIKLEQALDAAQAIYGEQFNFHITLKALSYYKDIEGLSDVVKHQLQKAVQQVNINSLLEVEEL